MSEDKPPQPVEPACAAIENTASGGPPRDEWEHLAYCPNCGKRLEKRHCKARCFHCGFFQDCSDTIV